ncbi:HD domain-containing phosphohydrolase [Sporomusa acidovorans]|nr:HD domain-containing phosphohydrolase [Sporomusa acidovorans]
MDVLLVIVLNLFILVIVLYIAAALHHRKSPGYGANGILAVKNGTRLVNKEKLFDIFWRHSPCAITAISPDFQILMLNEAATAIRGIPHEKAIHTKCYEAFNKDGPCPQCPVGQALTTGQIHMRTKQEVNHDGVVKYLDQTVVPILGSDGAVDYVLEFTVDVTERTELEQQNRQLAVETVTSLSTLIGSRDKYTGEHSIRVRDIALSIGSELRLSSAVMSELAIAAVLHDIGKIGIPEQILNKTGKLTDSEFAIIQKHPQIGYDALISIKQLEKIAGYILYHHECYDGRGYPSRKKGQEIPLISRILSVADVYEAITSDRIYRKAMNLEQTMMVMRSGRETKFDPEILDAFFCVLRRERPDIQSSLYEGAAVS